IGSVFRLVKRFRNNQSDTVADMSNEIRRQHGPQRTVIACAFRQNWKARTRHALDAFCADLLAGENAQDARGRTGTRFVDLDDPGMSVRRSQHMGEHHIRQREIVDEVTLAGHEAPILEATHRRAYSCAYVFFVDFHSGFTCSTLTRTMCSDCSAGSVQRHEATTKHPPRPSSPILYRIAPQRR